ncbi:MAG: hypothetical protein ABI655_04705 [Phenylobacterium sp.]
MSKAGRSRARRGGRPIVYLLLIALGFGAAILIAMYWRPGVL